MVTVERSRFRLVAWRPEQGMSKESFPNMRGFGSSNKEESEGTFEEGVDLSQVVAQLEEIVLHVLNLVGGGNELLVVVVDDAVELLRDLGERVRSLGREKNRRRTISLRARR